MRRLHDHLHVLYRELDITPSSTFSTWKDSDVSQRREIEYQNEIRIMEAEKVTNSFDQNK
jgi:hypothetical protein